jgi:hypothetical protein
MLELCKDTLRHCLAARLALEHQLLEAHREVERLRRVLQRREL